MKKVIAILFFILPVLSLADNASVVERCRIFHLDTGVSVVIRKDNRDNFTAFVTKTVNAQHITKQYEVKPFFLKNLNMGYSDNLNAQSTFELVIFKAFPQGMKYRASLRIGDFEDTLNCDQIKE